MKGISASRLPGLRTLLAALLVPALGGVLGAVAFAYENAHQPWRPQTTRTATGWRIVQGGRPPNNPAVGGDHLVWTWGADTILMDLTTGKTRLLGAGTSANALVPATISDRYVVFSQVGSQGSTTFFVYDISTGRRDRLPDDVLPECRTGDTVLWIADRGATKEVHAYDLSTGRRSVVASGDISYPLLADGMLVAWSSTQPAFPSPQGVFEPSPLLVKDTATGTVTTVPPPPHDSGRSMTQAGWVGLRDGMLLGVGTTPGQPGGTVLVRDLGTGATQTLGTAAPGTPPAMEAGTVVWVERDPGVFAASRIVGRHLDGSPTFEIAQVNGAVDALSIDGDWVAWASQGIARTWIETARLPQ